MADETTTTSTGTETTQATTGATGTTTTETKATGTETTTETKGATETQATTETKATETKADAPIDYSGLKLAEGWKADEPMVTDVLKIFGENKLSPEGAQKLIDFTVNRDKELAKSLNEANTVSWNKQADAWKADTAKKFSQEDLGNAKQAITKVFDTDTIKYLEALRLTDHPGVVGGLVKVFQAIKDDTFVNGNAASTGPRDARSNFPNSNMNP